MNRKLSLLGAIVAASIIPLGCGSEAGDTKSGIDFDVLTADGKSDLGSKAKIIEEIGPQATITGQFDPRTRVYGYVVAANSGARLNVALEALAGSDAEGPAAGAALDTVLAIYGPYVDRQNPGELIQETDDGEGSAAPPIDLTIEKDGKYLIAFMSYEDTGAGEYTLNLGCEGTDFQCRTPEFDTRDCKEGQLFVQGGEVKEDTVWENCEVVLLEPTVVAEGKILTIDPGVTVKGNFLQGDSGAAQFGTVTLTVNGTLQAAGTAANPVRFTSLTEQGWGGIVLAGQSNSIENAYVENANHAIRLQTGSTGEISDVVLDGELHVGEETVRAQAGISAQADSQAVFKRAMVHGYETGVRAEQAEQLLIEDSVIHSNTTGISVVGANPVTRCRAQNPPTVWRDPEIRYSDIYKNEHAIRVDGGDALLKVEFSNIVDNTNEALLIHGATLHEESFLRNNNIVRNNGGEQQVRSLHQSGQIDLSMNYWKDISDPALSANWNAECGGTIDFSGFHPQAVPDAGPRETDLVDDVKEGKLDVAGQVVTGE